MEKLCNVKPVRMVLCVGDKPFDYEKKNMRLTGIEMQIAMSCGTVEEVLNDGTTRILNEKNYNTADDKTITDIDAYLTTLEEDNAEEDKNDVKTPSEGKEENKNTEQGGAEEPTTYSVDNENQTNDDEYNEDEVLG